MSTICFREICTFKKLLKKQSQNPGILGYLNDSINYKNLLQKFMHLETRKSYASWLLKKIPEHENSIFK